MARTSPPQDHCCFIPETSSRPLSEPMESKAQRADLGYRIDSRGQVVCAICLKLNLVPFLIGLGLRLMRLRTFEAATFVIEDRCYIHMDDLSLKNAAVKSALNSTSWTS